MIAVDTSSLIAFFEGDSGPDVETILDALKRRIILLPPVVLTEFLSDPELPLEINALIKQFPIMEISEGYWIRAAKTRALVLAQKYKARLGDALIAQSCLDHDLPLVTRDIDFKAFSKHAGLKIILT